MKTTDADIRASLHAALRREHAEKLAQPLILDELSLCQGDGRIDIVLIDYLLQGYEIKSERDTLERLPRQIEVYNKVLDRITIVTAPCHMDEVIMIVPEWWGITKAEMDENGRMNLISYREALNNPDINAFSLAQLLWRDEAIEILKRRRLHKGLLSKPRNMLWSALSKKLNLQELRREVIHKLMIRVKWRE
ncbi:sce7726 family protein [Paenibacillus larvae]|uniref:Putative phage-related protein n=1 Tax=Paenibacillus larvae subsp. larvae DSM 25430 TaxID=697284 RepID=V9W404_9BACL|nr:sce7726 family protein [Paenibacillus larvae]AHD04694.1 putative phage-related protein [Paenibacillus larvae subsp. larvae DSM 25430]MDR5566971.1 sce7726 family protein [Paenibacillus larvae]MDR5595033.1 sce7726 family protein [Paenibacillus larvae]